jgi:prepilin-type N-terminal cleavage/methylation domain-containing protein
MMRRRGGFTLIETMVAGTIFASVALITVAWMTGTQRLWSVSSTQSQLQTDAQLALQRMAAELRGATRTEAGSPPNATIPASPNNTSITFFLAQDDIDGSEDFNETIVDENGNTEWNNATSIQYVRDAASQQLWRVSGGATTVLANNVTAVTFVDTTINNALFADEVQMTLTLARQALDGRTVTVTATERVKLRN